jgi:hypothetical protein
MKAEWHGRYCLDYGMDDPKTPWEVLAHPASYSTDTGVPYAGVKRMGCQADRSPPSTAGFKNKWKYTFTSQICLHGGIKNCFIHSTFCIKRNLHDLRFRQIEVNEISIPEQVSILSQGKKSIWRKSINVDWSFTFSSGYTQSIQIEIKFNPGF